MFKVLVGSLRMRLRNALAAVVYGLSVSGNSAAGSPNHLDIPAGDLTSALHLLARQTHVEFIYSAEDLKGVHTRGVHGDLTPESAVSKLLEGTDLTVIIHSSGAILITRSPPPGNPSEPPQASVGLPYSGARPAQSTRQAESIGEIVVTASRREELLSNVGVGITTVGGEELEARSASSLEDFVALVPGLNVQSWGTAGFGVVSIRGISPQSSGATVATYIDDVPFGGSSAVSLNAWYWPDIDPADLERVEVLKGPQGTLYGASSLGGVIKYVTRTPSLTTTEISTSEELNDVQGGSPGTKLRASVSTPIIENELALRVSGYYEYMGGYIDDIGIGGNDTNHGYKSGIRATLLYQPLDNLKVRLNASIQNSEVHGYNITDDSGPTFQPLYGYFEQKRYTPESFKIQTQIYSSDVQWDTDLGSLISVSSYSDFKPRQTEDLTSYAVFYPGIISTANPAGFTGGSYDEQRTQEIRFTSKRLSNFEFVAGTFYQHEGLELTTADYSYDTTGQLNPKAFLGGQVNTGKLDEYAGFGDATIYIVPQVDLTVGYRYSDIQQRVNQQFAGELYDHPGTVENFAEVKQTYLGGIRWRITDEVMLYGRAATGYRPGGARAVLPGAPAGFGDTYTSDRIRSYEAGVKVRSLGGRLTLSTDAYVIDWTNIQTLVYIGAFDTNGNAGTARSQGAEFEAVYVPIEGLTVGANTAYTDARFTETSAEANVRDGERLHYVPEWTRTVSIDYTLPLGTWKPQVGGEYAYRSSQLDATGIMLPGYSTFGVHAGVQFDKLSLRFYVKNLTNDRGIDGSIGYTPGVPYQVTYAQPRTFGMIFSQQF
jgi:iron complex outermembrane recepter protein